MGVLQLGSLKVGCNGRSIAIILERVFEQIKRGMMCLHYFRMGILGLKSSTLGSAHSMPGCKAARYTSAGLVLGGSQVWMDANYWPSVIPAAFLHFR